VDQLRSYADDRLVNGCIYCGGPEQTRDHAPSRVFLDAPLPDNLPIVAACWSCNNSYSSDEEYVAALVESVIAGSTDPGQMRRPRVANILSRAPGLRAKIEAARTFENGQTQFTVEVLRVRNVVLKLARAHSAFELSQVCRDEPSSIWWQPLALMADEQRELFDAAHFPHVFPEVGSRGVQRMVVLQMHARSAKDELNLGLVMNDWVDVQEDRYRYLAIHDHQGITIKIVLAEYLACEVTWALSR
jgi:hypothetical protein